MSSRDEGSVQKANFGPEGGEGGGGPRAGRGAPRGVGEGEGQGQGKSKGKSRGGLPEQQGPQSAMGSKREEVETGGALFWRSKAFPGSPGTRAQERAGAQMLGPHTAVGSAGSVEKQMSGQAGGQPRGARRSRSSESSAAHLLAIVGDLEAGPGERGVQAPSGEEAQQGSAASLPQASGPQGGQAWDSHSGMVAGGATPGPSSDQESSDELYEIQPMRVSICLKGGGQIKAICPREQGEPAKPPSVRARESAHHMQGSLPTSAPRGLTSAKERQRELETPSSKKAQSVAWGKGGKTPGAAGAAPAAAAATAGAAAAAASSSVPKAPPRKKASQEKKSLGGGSRVSLGRVFPLWGQRPKASPLEPATFPPIPGLPLLGRAKRHSLLPLGPKHSKHGSPGKRSSSRKARESQRKAREDNNPKREGVLQAQLSTYSPVPATLSVQTGELSPGDANIRAPQPPGNSQPFTWSQGGPRPRGPAPSGGDQEPTVQPPVPERQQQAPGGQGCPRCVELQKERDELKEQLAIMQALTKKFQGLGN